MKKTLSLLLGALLALTLCAGALAEAFYLEVAGVTIDVPEGMIAIDASDEAGYALIMYPEDRTELVYMYALYYLEDLKGVYLEDLEPEEVAALPLLTGFNTENEEVAYEQTTIGDMDYLVIADAGGAALHYVTLVDGWITDVMVRNMLGDALTDEEIELCETLILSIVYDEEDAP